MRDIKVDWSLSPKGATELVTVALIGQKWRNSKTKQYWDMNGDFAGYYGECSPIDEAKVIAIRPQIAAVADAVASFKATRENLEKIAEDAQGNFVEVEQEGEKWTHVVNFGFSEQAQCKIISEYGDFVWVQVDGAGCPATYRKSSLKPIKPTISRSDENALRAFAVWYENETDCESLLDEYLAKHEVIEG